MGTYRYYIFEVREEEQTKLVLETLDLISITNGVKSMKLNKKLLNKDDDYRVWLEELNDN
jgi:hypothetical protein